MHMVVCLKQVLDWEIPPKAFRVDRQAKKPDVPRAPLVMGNFDANALEVALQLKEAVPGSTITALTLGDKPAEEMLRKALAVTADNAVRVEAGDLGIGAEGKAALLAAAIRKLGPVDLVLAGRQASDFEAGAVPGMLAEELGVPMLPFVTRIAPAGAALHLRRETDDGYQIVAARGPLVVSISNDDKNVLRSAKIKDVMQATRKPITVYTGADLGAEAPTGATELADLFVPVRDSKCEIVPGDTPAQRGRALALRLRELGAI